jgi:hypothetical protein
MEKEYLAKASVPANQEIKEIAGKLVEMKKNGYPLVNSISYFKVIPKEKGEKYAKYSAILLVVAIGLYFLIDMGVMGLWIYTQQRRKVVKHDNPFNAIHSLTKYEKKLDNCWVHYRFSHFNFSFIHRVPTY